MPCNVIQSYINNKLRQIKKIQIIQKPNIQNRENRMRIEDDFFYFYNPDVKPSKPLWSCETLYISQKINKLVWKIFNENK